MKEKLFIGLPVYNGEKFISQAIESLIDQSFTQWKLLISDNASTDHTSEVCIDFCRQDPRIQYFRQPHNIGAMNNFKYLLDVADTNYFMWAAADDEWHKDFIQTCLHGLNDENVDWAFTNIVNIDEADCVVREYPSFQKYSNQDPYLRITNYVLSPEIFGKANLIYSIYRLEKVKPLLLSLLASQDSSIDGFDMVINLAMLCQSNISINPKMLFRKRISNQSSIALDLDDSCVKKPMLNGTMGEHFFRYQLAMENAVRETEFIEIVRLLMDTRAAYQSELLDLHSHYHTALEDLKVVSSELSYERNTISLKKVFRIVKNKLTKK
jgi:glycosyltransferase involved in cell wall biosynthesis